MILVTTCTSDRADAERIAAELIDSRLAACVQVSGPVRSTFRWEGMVESAEEWVCSAKTTRERYTAIESLIKRLHPYETPEVIATPIVETSPEYEAWLRGQVASD